MANKTIYICDKCGSYVDQSEVYEVSIGSMMNQISGSCYRTLSGVTLNGSPSVKRELCKTCIEKLVDELSLDKAKSTITKKAFDAFSLPKVDP